MEQERPSHTAYQVAVLRALHQRLDAPKVFDDPWAERVLGPDRDKALATAAESAARSLRLRATLVVRSRVVEEVLARALDRGVRQYVLLGAGLDTFAFRNTVPDLAIFEVDHPATQGWKRRRLEQAGLVPPEGLRFVPVDFEHQSLRQRLAEAGFHFDEPAVFSLLGVVPYVDRASVLATLGMIASTASSAEIVFDYSEPFAAAPASVRGAYEAVAARVAASGEPWVTFFAPEELRRELADLGFSSVEDMDAATLNGRYFAGRDDGLAVPPLFHVTVASVGLPA